MKSFKGRVFSLILILVIVFISLLPTLLSAPLGKSCILWIYHRMSGNQLSLDQLNISWKGPQTFEGIQWSDKQAHWQFQSKQVELECSLIELFKTHTYFKKARFLSPHLTARPDLHSPSSLALQQMDLFPKIQWHLQSKFSGHFEIIDGSAAIYSKRDEIARFKDISALFTIEKEVFPLKLQIQAQTYQGNIRGSCSIQASLDSLDLNHPQFEINTRMDHFPISGFDALSALFYPQFKNIFIEALGTTIDLELHASSQKNAIELSFQANSQFFKASFLTAVQGQSLALKNPSQFSLTIDPAIGTQLLSKCLDLSDIVFQSPLQLTFSLNQFAIPITSNGLDISRLACQADLKTAPLTLTVHQDPLELNGSLLTFETDNLNHLFTVNSNHSLQIQKQAFHFEMEGSCRSFFEPNFQATAALTIHNLPLSLLSSITSTPVFSSLGSTLDSHIEWNCFQDHQTWQCQLKTELLDVPLISLQSDSQWHLLKPCLGSFNWISDKVSFNIGNLNFPKLSDIQEIHLEAIFSFPQKTAGFSFLHELCQQMECTLLVDTLNKIHLTAQAPRINTDLLASFDLKTRKIQNKQHFWIRYQPSAEDLHLKSPSFLFRRLDMHVEQLSTLLTQEEFYKSMHLKSEGTLQMASEAISEEGAYSLVIDSSAESLHATFTSKIVAGMAHSDSWNMQDPLTSLLQFNLSINELPLSLIASLFHTPSLPTLWGNTISGELGGLFDEKTFSCSFKGSTPFAECGISLQAKDGKIFTQDKASFKWKIPANELSAYFQKSAVPYTSSSAFLMQLQMNEWECPLHFDHPLKIANWKWDLSQLNCRGKLSVDPLVITQLSSGKSLSSSLWSIDFNKKSSEPLLILQSLLQISSKENSPTKEGSLQLTSSVDCRNFHWTSPTFDLEAKMQKMPILCCDFLYTLFTQKPFIFSSLLGNFFNLNFSLHVKEASGPMDLSFLSDHARCSIAAAWQSSSLTLLKPLYAQIDVTKESSAELLKEINPLSISSLQADHPLTLEIAPDGFSASFFPFNLSTLNIDKCRIELGQIHCQNEGNLNIALGLLKQNISPASTLDLWFAPMDLYLHKGSLEIERTEILVQNSLEICTWGTIDFMNDRLSMILGLTSQCLKKAFGIKNLPPNYVLQIPMEGSLDNVRIDIDRATNKVTALLLWQAAASAAAEKGGAVGGFFSDLLGKAALLPDKDLKAPPPKKPFPWDKQKKNQNTSLNQGEEKSSKKKCHIKKREKPIKQLFKILK